MAMFNSNLTSSISGWFSNAFQPSPKEKTEDETKQDNVPQESEETPASDDQVNNKDETVEEPKNEEASESNPEAGDEEDEKEIVDIDKSQTEDPEQKDTTGVVLDKEHVQKKIAEETQKMMQSAKTFGTYLFGVASEAGKKVSTTVNETASTLKKTVEDFEEKSILGDLNREQKEFIQRKREKQGDGAVPPWMGYHEEETMKQQILALSSDSRNFLRSPPAGVQFQFDFQQMFPVAMATLKEDENLTKMRFHLVPTKIKEEIFWRNYFYRISLIKQSAQLSTLSEMQKSTAPDAGSSESSSSSIVVVGSTATGTTMSRSSSSKSLTKPDGESANSKSSLQRNAESPDLTEPSDDLPPAEFVSDAFDPSTLNPDDLEREMKELGMDGEKDDGIPGWEQELQKELQDYEVVQDNNKDEVWEQEIESMLTGHDADP